MLTLTLTLNHTAHHTALNLGQACRDLTFLSLDLKAAGFNPVEVLSALTYHMPRLAGNIFYACIPPHTHHHGSDLIALSQGTVKSWFLLGLMP